MPVWKIYKQTLVTFKSGLELHFFYFLAVDLGQGTSLEPQGPCLLNDDHISFNECFYGDQR